MSGYGQPSKFLEQRPLTALQSRLLDAYLECDEDVRAASSKVRISTHHAYNILRSARVQFELAVRERTFQRLDQIEREHLLSRDTRLDMLWNIAQASSEMRIDSVGNEVMAKPNCTVRAIVEINRMINDCDPKPEKVPAADNRSEAEIRASIRSLLAQVGGRSMGYTPLHTP